MQRAVVPARKLSIVAVINSGVVAFSSRWLRARLNA